MQQIKRMGGYFGRIVGSPPGLPGGEITGVLPTSGVGARISGSTLGVQPPQTVDELLAAAKALTTSKVKGLFVGNDGGVGVLGGPLLWSAGLDYLTKDNTFGFDDPAAAEAFGKLRALFTSGSLLLGAPTDWSDPSAMSRGSPRCSGPACGPCPT